MLAPDSFFEFKLPNLVTYCGIVLAYLGFRRDNKKETERRTQAWEHMIEEQTTMHTENRLKLDALLKFQDSQQDLNIKRDFQISSLSVQTASLTEIAKGFNRRLEMLEDK